MVIGGGVMGLFTAYHASERVDRVVVLERGRIGDPMTASFGRTRSYRSDYLDPAYARLAREALRLWEEFETQTGTATLIRCGCMNIAKRSVTPDLESTYAQRSHRVLEDLGIPTASLDGKALRARFPYLEADVGYIDLDGGVVNLTAVTAALCVTDMKAAASFYQKALGFQKRSMMNGPDGKPMHAELTMRGTTLMLGPEMPEMGARSAKKWAPPRRLYT